MSDLLDYINPNQENKGRDSESGKRRYSSIKVGYLSFFMPVLVFCLIILFTSYSSCQVLSHSNESSNGASPEASPRDSTPIIDEEQHVKELPKDDGTDVMSEAEVKQSPNRLSNQHLLS